MCSWTADRRRAARGVALKPFKSLALPAVWILGTVVSTGVAYAAVQLVSGSVVEVRPETPTSTSISGATVTPMTPPGILPSPQATTIPSGAPSVGPTPLPPPKSAPSAPGQQASNARTFSLVGGATQLTCSGNSIMLNWATPNSGFWVETSTENGGATLEVRFRSDTHESRLDAWCSSGTIQFNVREQSS